MFKPITHAFGILSLTVRIVVLRDSPQFGTPSSIASTVEKAVASGIQSLIGRTAEVPIKANAFGIQFSIGLTAVLRDSLQFGTQSSIASTVVDNGRPRKPRHFFHNLNRLCFSGSELISCHTKPFPIGFCGQNPWRHPISMGKALQTKGRFL